MSISIGEANNSSVEYVLSSLKRVFIVDWLVKFVLNACCSGMLENCVVDRLRPSLYTAPTIL